MPTVRTAIGLLAVVALAAAGGVYAAPVVVQPGFEAPTLPANTFVQGVGMAGSWAGTSNR